MCCVCVRQVRGLLHAAELQHQRGPDQRHLPPLQAHGRLRHTEHGNQNYINNNNKKVIIIIIRLIVIVITTLMLLTIDSNKNNNITLYSFCFIKKYDQKVRKTTQSTLEKLSKKFI